MSLGFQDFFDYKQVNRTGKFTVGSRLVSHNDVTDTLSKCVTEDRVEKLKEIVSNRTYNVAPVLENIYDKGNISAVMRSAEAFGFLDFNIVEPPGSRFKDSNRVSKGTEKWLDIKKFSSSKECVRSLKDKGFKIYCTHLEASVPISEMDFSGPTAVVLGNEKDGVSDEMVELADGNFILPMVGFAQSFNISVAGALTFYHIFSERVRTLGRSGDLSDEEQNILLANYLVRSVGSSHKILNNKLSD